MKLATFAFSTALFSSALAEIFEVQLFALSNTSVSGDPLYSVHEGAGFNFFILGAHTSDPETFKYDTEKSELFDYEGHDKYVVGHQDNYLSNALSGGQKVTFDNDKLSVNQQTTFHAARNTGDPSGYSKDNYIILLDEIKDSITISIQVVFPNGQPSPSLSPPPLPLPSPSPSYSNTTITTTVTYTEGETTVITITSCPPDVPNCPPTTVTTVVPVTKTSTYCPATTTPTFSTYTPTPSTQTTVADQSTGKTTDLSSSGAPSSAPNLTENPNGAAKAGSIAGAGLVAFAAFLF